MYSAVGKEPAVDDEARKVEWDRAVTGLAAAAERAEALGVRLAIEPLNRFETDLVNTTEQGLALCADIGSPAAGLLLDTFHMNIEEKSIGDAIRACRRPVGAHARVRERPRHCRYGAHPVAGGVLGACATSATTGRW